MLLQRLSFWQRCSSFLKLDIAALQQVLRQEYSTQGYTKPTCMSVIYLNITLNGTLCMTTQQTSRYSNAVVRPFSTSAIHFSQRKKNDPKKLQLCNVYDHNGEFIKISELFNVEKFCAHHKRMKMQTLDKPLGAEADPNLPSIQISYDPIKEAPKRIKQIALNKSETWAMEKLKRTLIEDGCVTIDISGKKKKEIKETFYKDWIPKVCQVSTIKETSQEILLKATLKETINSQLFKLLYEEICDKNEEFLQQLRELAELEKSEE